jgi:hypothetical protein
MLSKRADAALARRPSLEGAASRVVSDDAGNSLVIHYGVQFHGYLVKEEELQRIEEKTGNIGADLNVAIASLSAALSIGITLLMALGSINGARLTVLIALACSCLSLGIDRLRRYRQANDSLFSVLGSIRNREAVKSSS